MIYITGDTHRDFGRLNLLDFEEDDVIIILGDVGINYFLDEQDRRLKENLNRYYKLFCIQGNHEKRADKIKSYKEVDMFGGKVYIEQEYPNLIFAKNGEVYNIGGKSVLVVGGAYSVDKDYRILAGFHWFSDEQLDEEERNMILNKCKGKHFDIVLTHTCPLSYVPTEAFLEGIDQSKVDKTMEEFLEELEKNISYDKWYCGHYHINKIIDKIEFLFEDIKEMK